MDQRIPSSEYRPEIDGLRAIAVLAVILFHINSRWVPGGFVGVDVFFVISGYLVTGIITRELLEGRFTFGNFYQRRIRRILPALWVLLIVCVPVSWWLMLPKDAEPMGKSAIWSTLAMANVYFWRDVSTDYFAPQSAQLPFLHLWSLGVEEQFYILWPAILLIMVRLARQRARATACAFALALVLGSTLIADGLLTAQETRFAYYMLPTRAGELALGAGLALAGHPFAGRRSSADVARIAAVLGWVLLAHSFAALSENNPFPGWRALPPTIGAAALILAGQLAPTDRWVAPLRWDPVLWLGRCSYSAYLWHWPVLAWWRYLSATRVSPAAGLALLALILALAAASKRWVEDPVRRSRSSFSRALVLCGIAPALLIVVLGLVVARGDRWGVPLYTESERKAWAELERYTLPAHRIEWVCQQHILDPASLASAKCEFGTGEGPARILLLGDSHAAEFAPMLRVAAESQGMRIRSVALGSCAPLTGSLTGIVADWRVEACERGVPKMLERANDFPLLIIGAAWSTYASNDANVWERLQSQLRVLTARGHHIWLLPSVPEFSDYDADCLAKRARVGEWLKCPAELVPRDDGVDTNAHLAAIARRVPGVQFLPINEALCTLGRCPLYDAQGHNLYSDGSHLSVHGSRYLATELIRTNRMPSLSVLVGL